MRDVTGGGTGPELEPKGVGGCGGEKKKEKEMAAISCVLYVSTVFFYLFNTINRLLSLEVAYILLVVCVERYKDSRQKNKETMPCHSI